MVPTPKSAKSARDKADIDAAAGRARQKLASAALAARAPRQPAAGKNDYLTAVIDPLSATAPSIPDGTTLPSTKFKTTYVDAVRTDANGRFLAFHSPTLDNGGFHPGLTVHPGGVFITAFDPSSPLIAASGVVFTNYEVHDVLTSTIKASLIRNFAAVRPVSMVVEAIPTASALNAKGFASAGLIPAEQLPASVGPIPGVPALLATYCPSAAIADNAVSNFSDLLSGAGYVSDTLKPFNVVWRPEDGRSLTYRNTATSVNPAYDPMAAGGFFAGPTSIRELRPETSQVLPTYGYDGVSDATICWIPGGLAYASETINSLIGPINASFSYTERPAEDYAYPSVWIAFEGCTPNTDVYEIKVTINWEALPITAQRSVIAATPSPANPDELTQAANIVPMLPVAYNPDNSAQPENKIITAAKTATSALYDGTSRKTAIEGTSWLNKVAGVVGKVSGMLPFPLSTLASGASALVGALTSK